MSVVPMRRHGPDAAALTNALRGYTELRGFELAYEPHTLRFKLRLTLAEQKQGATKVLLCHDVQNLELNPNGEQFHQLLLLRVEDVREDGLDRIHFTVDELENGTLFLHCAALELVG